MTRDDLFTPEHKTNILPLRWIANNLFHPASMWFFRMSLHASDRWEYAFDTYYTRHAIAETVGAKLYNILDKPYTWWGTYYKFNPPEDFKLNLGDISGGWDDYDDNGIPYWDFLWHDDDEHGSNWRLISND